LTPFVFGQQYGRKASGSSCRNTTIRGETFPLNSKRLMGRIVQWIARGVRLLTSVSLEDTRQMLEGKLGEMDREPCNVQVVLRDIAERSMHISLRDVDGTFLEIEPEKIDEDKRESDGERESERESDGGERK